jgi:plasmid stabilization system protein ParE
MSRYRFTKKAKADFFAILAYITADSADAADRVESAILDTCEFLASHPFSCRRRPGVY